MAEIKDLYHGAGRGRWKRRHPLVINQSGENSTDYLSLLEEAGSLNVVERCGKALYLLLGTDQSCDPLGFCVNTGSVLSLASNKQW